MYDFLKSLHLQLSLKRMLCCSLKTCPFSLPSKTFNSPSLKICYAHADAINLLNLNIKRKDTCNNFESAKLTS